MSRSAPSRRGSCGSPAIGNGKVVLHRRGGIARCARSSPACGTMDAAVLLARRSCSPGRGRQAGASDRADYQPDAPTRQPPSALRRRDEPRPPADAVAGYLEARARGVAAPAFFPCCGRGMVTPRFRYRQFDPLRAPAAATVLPLVTRGAKHAAPCHRAPVSNVCNVPRPVIVSP